MHTTVTCRCHHGAIHANKLSDFSRHCTDGRANRSSPAATSTIDFQAVSLQISRDTLHLKAGRELGRVLVAYLPVFCCSARLFGGSLCAYAGSTRAGSVPADLAGLSRAELCARPPDVALHEPMGAAGSLPGLSLRRTAIPRAWRNGFGRAHLVPNHRAGDRRRSSQKRSRSIKYRACPIAARSSTSSRISSAIRASPPPGRAMPSMPRRAAWTCSGASMAPGSRRDKYRRHFWVCLKYLKSGGA